jgi:hypothetical protein
LYLPMPQALLSHKVDHQDIYHKTYTLSSLKLLVSLHVQRTIHTIDVFIMHRRKIILYILMENITRHLS